MKHIKKLGAPKIYSDWCKAVKGKINEDYRHLHSNERNPLKEALLTEQGELCAYTMRRISMDSCHIEHIKPETLCREDLVGSDLDYRNMLACFPKEGMKTKFRYGAQEKGNWWADSGKNFISPLAIQCESLITFNIEGKVTAYRNNKRAKQTIELLKLDHKSLIEDRKRAINEFIYGHDGDSPISKNSAQQAIDDITNLANGKYIEFCIAIKHALKEYILQLDKIATKRKFAKQQKRK